jgi:nucleoside 2-deoxyribosyltransferase
MITPAPKVYIAARFSRRAEMASKADYLKSCGFIITSRWVYGGEDGLTREQIAMLDLTDVDRADIVLSFTEDYGTPVSGGGRHTEFGYGLAKNKQIVVIGDREQVFHHHSAVEQYPTVEMFVANYGKAAADAA